MCIKIASHPLLLFHVIKYYSEFGYIFVTFWTDQSQLRRLTESRHDGAYVRIIIHVVDFEFLQALKDHGEPQTKSLRGIAWYMHHNFAQRNVSRFVEERPRPFPHFRDSRCIVNLVTSSNDKTWVPSRQWHSGMNRFRRNWFQRSFHCGSVVVLAEKFASLDDLCLLQGRG